VLLSSVIARTSVCDGAAAIAAVLIKHSRLSCRALCFGFKSINDGWMLVFVLEADHQEKDLLLLCCSVVLE